MTNHDTKHFTRYNNHDNTTAALRYCSSVDAAATAAASYATLKC